MIRGPVLTLMVLWCLTFHATPIQAGELTPSSLDLQETMHFTALDGSDVVMDAATYQVEQGIGTTLRLLSTEGKEALVIGAIATTHDEELASPVALLISDEDGEPHIVFLLPGGNGLDAIGSSTGVRPRGAILKTVQSTTVKSAVSKIPPPSPPLAVVAPKIVPSASATQGTASVAAQGPVLKLFDAGKPQFPEEVPCIKDGASYVRDYRPAPTSGFLDLGMIMNGLLGNIIELQRMMDDQKARIEAIYCEEAESNAKLDYLVRPIAAAAALNLRITEQFTISSETPVTTGSAGLPASLMTDCRRGSPPAPYGPLFTGRTSNVNGFIDNGTVIQTGSLLHNAAIEVLNDIQARLEQLQCDSGRIAAKMDYYVSHTANTPMEKIGGRPCPRGAANPSYVKVHINTKAEISGLMDFNMVVRSLHYSYVGIEGFLDDLQIRLERLACQQLNIKAASETAIKIHRLTAGKQMATEVTNLRTQVAGEGRDAQVLKERASSQQMTGKKSELPNPRIVLDALPPPEGAEVIGPAPHHVLPRDQSCANLSPNPSYVQPIRHWFADPNAPNGPYHVWIQRTDRNLEV